MSKDIIAFDNIETEKCKFRHRLSLSLIIYQYLVWFLLVKKIITTLFVIKMLIIKLRIILPKNVRECKYIERV